MAKSGSMELTAAFDCVENVRSVRDTVNAIHGVRQILRYLAVSVTRAEAALTLPALSTASTA
jgi:hypothetical protein